MKAVEHRHLEIHQHRVGLEVEHQAEGLGEQLVVSGDHDAKGRYRGLLLWGTPIERPAGWRNLRFLCEDPPFG